MFVFSFRLRKGLLISLLCSVILLIVVWQVIGGAAVPTAAQNSNLSFRGMDSDEARVALLAQCGWQVDPTPVEVSEVTIPREFDEVYEEYNALQKEQGFDLSRYKGARMKRWTYLVNNYSPPQQSAVYASLLVYKDHVVGGEVYTTALNGFMHGFIPAT